MYVILPACSHRWASTISKQTPSRPPATTSWQAMTPFFWQSLGFWHHKRTDLTNRLCVTLLKVVFFYYPSLLATILSLFACYHIDPATPGSELYPQYAQVRKPMCYTCCPFHASSGCIHLHHSQGSNFASHLSATCRLSPAPQACKDSLSMNALFQVYEHASCLVPSAESALTPITKDEK